jgi:peptidoglycan/xylan/chitin deacetylase (PgdA/CDA1 family)
MAARYGEGRLPHHSLLLTFDDGFADNLDYALPLLRKHKAPTVVFVSTDLIGRAERLWTEDLLWAARAGYLHEADLQALCRLVTGHAPSTEGGSAAVVREIVRAGPSYAFTAVESALGAPIDLKRISEPRQMLDRGDIIELAQNGVAIGAHGKTHTALDYAQDLTDELETPRATLCELLGGSARPGMDALAFPHGVYTPEIVDRALATGYRLVFTMDGGLSALDKGRLRGSVVGRINIDGQRIAENGQLRPERLAVTLFTATARALPSQGRCVADALRL